MTGVLKWRDTGSIGRTGVRKQLECMELSLGMDKEPPEINTLHLPQRDHNHNQSIILVRLQKML